MSLAKTRGSHGKKATKGVRQQRQHMQVKSSGGETSAHGSGDLEPMELGVVTMQDVVP